ncbi:MAG: M55 family metallopeptidase [Vicinamibacterales bacterium]
MRPVALLGALVAVLSASVLLQAGQARPPAAATAPPQPARKLKVLVLCDMEGVSRATDVAHTEFSHPAEYASGREALTDDVNAAIAGLKAAGVEEIVVVDGHGSGNTTEPDVIEQRLLAPAKMIERENSFDIYMDSYDQSFDGVVAVAMHAGAGNLSGFLSHTYSGAGREYRVNGVPFNETMILGMGAARLRLPVIMASGDDHLEKELRRHMPWVQYAAVKHAVDRTKAEPLPPDEVRRRIETAARTAVERLDQARLFEMPGPYRFAITFSDEAQARNAAGAPGAEAGYNATTVQVRADDFEEGYRRSLRLYSLAGLVISQANLAAVLAAAPDAAALREKLRDLSDDRFLYRPLPAASSPSAQPRRPYWGAR